VLSYIVASFAAVLSAFCYTEFAVDMPVAGGAFVYINLVFGEFIGWCAHTFCCLARLPCPGMEM
jgi:amino acid transporter